MPLVKVEILKGKTQEYKLSILDGIHKALVESLGIPDDDRIQRIYELDKDNFEFPPNKSENFCIIELTIFAGRTNETKKKIFSAIVNNLEKSPGIKRTDVLIVINEPSLENWGIRGGIPASEANLGFKVDV